jgi:transcriptional regulator with PAS, ATPase and Fis domain
MVRVGGLKPIPVDARIIAATNRDLKEMVVSESFREDLYYRLNVVAIEIPPLRERKEDIPLLTLHFLEKINKKYGFTKRISTEVVDNFILYSWPGNIRELENVIERMLVMTEEEQITAMHLPVYIRNRVHQAPENVIFYDNVPFKRAVERAERQILERAIKKHGSTRRVATALRINQSTVVRKIKKYGLSSLCLEPDEPENPFENPRFRI